MTMNKFIPGKLYQRVKRGISSVPITIGRIYKALPETTSGLLVYVNDNGSTERCNIKFKDCWKEVFNDHYDIY